MLQRYCKTLYSSSMAIFCLCIILPLHGFNYHKLAPAFYIHGFICNTYQVSFTSLYYCGPGVQYVRFIASSIHSSVHSSIHRSGAWFVARFIARFVFTVLIHKLASYMHASPAQLRSCILGRQGEPHTGIQVTPYSTTCMGVAIDEKVAFTIAQI